MEIEEITEWNDERVIGQNTAYSNAITPEKNLRPNNQIVKNIYLGSFEREKYA